MGYTNDDMTPLDSGDGIDAADGDQMSSESAS